MRSMRSGPAVLWVLSLSLSLSLFALARPAHAGDPLVLPPVTGFACGEDDIAVEAMNDPSTAFGAAGPGLCEKLCRKGGKLCRGYVKKSFACYLSLEANELSFGLINCELTTDNSADERECKALIRAGSNASTAGIKAGRDSEFANCDDWTSTCEASCPNP